VDSKSSQSYYAVHTGFAPTNTTVTAADLKANPDRVDDRLADAAGRARGTDLCSGLALFLGQHVIQYGLIMAGSVLAIVPVVVAFLLIQRRFVESIATSGLR
jgi:hypothetical protein